MPHARDRQNAVYTADRQDSPLPPVAEPTRRRRRLLRDLAAIGLLIACGLAFFEPIFTGRMFSTLPAAENKIYPWAAYSDGEPHPIQSDQATLSYGWDTFDSRALRHGELPFWDPHTFTGYPHLANGSAGVFNPVRFGLDFVTAPGWAHDLFSMINVVGGGIFAFLFARDLNLRRAGSLLAAVAWMLSSWNLGWLHFEVVSPIIMLFPAGMLATGRAMRERGFRWVIGASMILAVTLISGHLPFMLVNFYICLLYGLALVLAPVLHGVRDFATARTRSVRLATTTAGSIALAAPVIVPTFIALQDTQRTPFTYAQLQHGLLAAPSWFLTTFIPPKTPISAEILSTRMVFAGTATAVLAIVGLLHWRKPAVKVGGLLMAGLFLVAVGTPLTWLVFHLVPGMNVFRPYSRLEMWWPLGLALLAGTGLDLVVSRIARWNARAALTIALVVVVVTAAQLTRYGHLINPRFAKRDANSLFADTPLIRAMHADGTVSGGWPARTIGLGGQVLSYNTPLVLDIDAVSGYDSTIPRRTSDLVRVLAGERPDTVLNKSLDKAFRPLFGLFATPIGLLARMGISRAVLAPKLNLNRGNAASLRKAGAKVRYQGPDGTLVDLPSNGPRLVGGTLTVGSKADAFHTFLGPTFDHTAQIVLEADQRGRVRTQQLPSQPGPAGHIVRASRGINDGRLEVIATRAAWLLIPEAWDPGWTAEVNGKSAAVLRANYQQRAILVAGGRSVVTLRYRPEGWGLGVFIFELTGLAFITGTALSVRRRVQRHRALAAAA